MISGVRQIRSVLHSSFKRPRSPGDRDIEDTLKQYFASSSWLGKSLEELQLSACCCRKFTCDVLGDHVSTCTAHSGAKKAHDWAVEKLADLFRTTLRVQTQQVAKSRGQRCGDIELAAYLANAAGPVPLVLD